MSLEMRRLADRGATASKGMETLKAKLRSSIAIAVGFIGVMIMPASATGTWCGMFDYSSDSNLNLRAAPSAEYRVVQTVSKRNLMFIDTAQCRADFQDGVREFSPSVCSPDGRWVFVEGIAANGDISTAVKGWANSRYIRQVDCPN
jgi:hypothetical protein